MYPYLWLSALILVTPSNSKSYLFVKPILFLYSSSKKGNRKPPKQASTCNGILYLHGHF